MGTRRGSYKIAGAKHLPSVSCEPASIGMCHQASGDEKFLSNENRWTSVACRRVGSQCRDIIPSIDMVGLLRAFLLRSARERCDGS